MDKEADLNEDIVLPKYDRAFLGQLYRQAQSYDIQLLCSCLAELSVYANADVLLYAASYITENNNQINPQLASVNDLDIPALTTAMKGMGERDLLFIIHSPGGDGNVAAQIIEYVRKKYIGKKITAVVPHKAMSAATMICMGCDEILMTKLASLGPIDPQFFGIPASAILAEKEEAMRDIVNNPDAALFWNKKHESLPPGIYQICKDATAYAQEVVERWLATYMFANDKNNKHKSKQLAKWLADGNKHKSHGRPFTFELLKEKQFNVHEVEDDDVQQNLIMGIFHAFRHVFASKGMNKIICNHRGDIEAF